MRVLWISDSPLLPSGLAKQTDHICRGLAERGVEVFVLGAYYHGPARGMHGYTLLPCPASTGFQSGFEELVVQLSRKLRLDLLVSFTLLRRVAYLGRVASRIGRKWLCYLPMDGPPTPGLAERLDGEMQNGCLILLSNTAKQQIESSCSVKTGLPIPLGLPAGQYVPLPERQRLRADAGLQDMIVLGRTDRNTHRKNYAALFEAFGVLCESLDDVVLVIHADPADPFGKDLRLLRRFYRLGQRVRFTCDDERIQSVVGTGVLDEAGMRRLYNLFDIYVSPTQGEGFGMTLLESIACGVPVVVTDWGSARETVGPGGLLVPPQRASPDPERGVLLAEMAPAAFAEVVHSLCHDPTHRRSLSAKGLDHANTFTTKRTVAAWLDVLVSQH
ncbi:MAG: hypothetical protein COZ05_01015 [Armatimonadetes bacterium CG_4_10_14_3_um_filter_59_10]|nr:MAG: hypothetical protein COZ05_01015 [Armatimonadetes bacterium CG_4_10_14_3_um_filter_59_10]